MAIITATESLTVRLIDPDADLKFDPEDVYDGPSRSQKKREVEALQEMGALLVELPAAQFKRMVLPDALREAVAACRKITQNGALRRQKQFIGKLMRSVDPLPIQAQLDAFNGSSVAETARLHQAERWRDRLLAESDALTLFVNAHPAADATHLRQLIRAAHDETAKNKPPKAFRELFRVIRVTLADAPEPP
jgi:ribosome-associated protein